MYCKNCGKEIATQSKFCTFCGAEIKEEKIAEEIEEKIKEEKIPETKIPATNEPQSAQTEPFPSHQKKSQKKWKPIAVMALVFLLGISAGAVAVYFTRPSKSARTQENQAESQTAADANNNSRMENGTTDNNQSSNGTANDTKTNNNQTVNSAAGDQNGTIQAQQQTAPTAQPIQLSLKEQVQKLNGDASSWQTIDIYAENYNDRVREASQEECWDSTLFTTLEDINKEIDTDGLIDMYNIESRMLKCAGSGNLIEYNIYKHPNTGRVNKIVSIEHKEDSMLEITDYYYTDDGKISMIFVRKDSSYTPDYATGGKNGERFYFTNDAMTKYRIVQDGDVEKNIKDRKNYVTTKAEIEEAKKAPTSNKYIKLVNKASEDIKKQYAVNKVKMLNAAYNTYGLVVNTSAVNQITGNVFDADGEILANAVVRLYTKNTKECIYETKTDENGRYELYIPFETEDSFYLEVSKEGYVSVKIYDINPRVETTVLSQNNIYLTEKSDDAYMVHVTVYDAFDEISEEEGMMSIPDAKLNIRAGVNNRTGEVIETVYADEYGYAEVSLEPGMYTVELIREGYENSFSVLTIRRGEEEISIYGSPELCDGAVRIVLTWGNCPDDLDSHLFVPNDNSEGTVADENENPYHIWYNRQSNQNASLDVDDMDGYGPETTTIYDVKDGTYKYYVADFTNCYNGNTNGYDMSRSGAEVRVFTSDGQAETFYVPANRRGVIWEVFEIRNGVVSPINRYYNNIENKRWWNQDK